MLPKFTYVRAKSLDEALTHLSSDSARVHAGGSDLLGCLRDEVFECNTVVSISDVAGLRGITATGDGGGIFVNWGGATLSGGQIAGNTAANGGGVYVDQITAIYTQTGEGILAHNQATLLQEQKQCRRSDGKHQQKRERKAAASQFVASGALQGCVLIS